MKLGEVNRTMVIVLIVVIVGVVGWSWYSMLYKPAAAAATAAATTRDQSALALDTAQQRLAEVEKTSGQADRRQMGEIALAAKAIPKRHERTEAFITLDRIAARTGVVIREFTPSESGGAEGGLVPLDLLVQAHGTYPALQLFSREVQDLVDVNRGKTYITDQLFSVEKLVLESGSKVDLGDGEQLPKGHQSISITLRMYAESSSEPGAASKEDAAANTAAPGAAGTAPTPGAAPTAGAPAAGAPAAGTTPGTTAPAAGTSPAATTPAATTPSSSNEAVPSGVG